MNRSVAAEEWRQNWTVVLAACAGVAVSTLNTYSLGVFIEPLHQAFGWRRAQISLGQVIGATASLVFSPFVGALLDRYGPRWFGLLGTIAWCSCTAMLALAGPGIWTWWLLYSFVAASSVFMAPTIWTTAVTSVFFEGRGLALAVTLSGAGLGSLLTPALTVYLIQLLGWRGAYPALASLWALVTIPLLVLFFRTRPQSVEMQAMRRDRARHGLLAVARSEMLNLRFVRLAVATLLIASVVVSLAATIFQILAAEGFSRMQSAGIASILGASSIGGRLVVGMLLDRFEGRSVAACAVLLPVAACILLLTCHGSITAATVAVAFLGLALGAELDVVSYLTSRLFNVAHFGTIFGAIVSFVTLAGGTGPFILNTVFDWTGSYRPALIAAIPMCIVSSLLFLSLPAVRKLVYGGS